MPLVATGRCGACHSMISGKSSCRPSTLSRSGCIPGSGMTSWICSSCFSQLSCFSVSERPLPLYWGFGRWLFLESLFPLDAHKSEEDNPRLAFEGCHLACGKDQDHLHLIQFVFSNLLSVRVAGAER